MAVNGSTSTSFTITDSQFTGNTAGEAGHQLNHAAVLIAGCFRRVATCAASSKCQ